MSNQLQVPASLDAEEALLGAVILSPAQFIAIDTFLDPSDFFITRHATIWTAIQRLNERKDTVDYLTVGNELSQMGELDEIGGPAYLTELVNKTPSSVHAEVYARIVERTSVRRKLLAAADEARRVALDEDIPVDKVLSEAEEAIRSVSAERLSQDITLLGDSLADYYDEIERFRETGEAPSGIPTGFTDVDTLIGGLNKSDLIIFAGRTGMGKTSWLLSTAINVARWGHTVVIFSMEMSTEQIAQRFVSMESGITIKRLRRSKITDDEMSRFVEVIGRLSKLPIYIDDTPFLTSEEVMARSRRVQHEVGLSVIIVDYIQNLSPGNRYRGNRVQEVSYISRMLKETARDLDVTVLAAAQLSREVEKRTNKRPMLSDLRESGCLAGDTEIYLPDKGYSVCIESLVGQSGFQVLSLNTETYKLEPGVVTNAFSTGIKPVYRMTTALGRSIKATGNHKFFTIHGWKRLDELEVGTHVAVPRVLHANHKSDMKDSELALMGHLIGDGCTLKSHSIQYTTGKIDLAEIVVGLASELFGGALKPRIDKVKGREYFQVFFPSTKPLSRKTRNPIAEWLDGYGIFDLRSHEKRIPEKVSAQPPEKIACFLRHLWATDGCINMRKSRGGRSPVIYYATSSPKLASGVSQLLLRLGIISKVSSVSQGHKGRDQYHVTITGQQDVSLYAKTVGAIGMKQSVIMEEINKYLESNKPNTNRDVIPSAIWHQKAVPAMKSIGMTSRQMYQKIGTAYAGTSIYKQNISRARALRLGEAVQSDEICNLARSDVYWDKIVSIEAGGECAVYDLTVESYHNFCGTFVLHNSIEQDSDAVLFLYRDSYYNPETDFPGMVEVNIAKHRHGPTGMVYLHFNQETTRFSNATKLELGDF